MTSKYNGWTNRETWIVNLWLTNEETDQRHWAEQAAECRRFYPRKLDAPYARSALADRLASEIREYAADKLHDEANMIADLVNVSLGAVNWTEIAAHFLETVEA